MAPNAGEFGGWRQHSGHAVGASVREVLKPPRWRRRRAVRRTHTRRKSAPQHQSSGRCRGRQLQKCPTWIALDSGQNVPLRRATKQGGDATVRPSARPDFPHRHPLRRPELHVHEAARNLRDRVSAAVCIGLLGFLQMNSRICIKFAIILTPGGENRSRWFATGGVCYVWGAAIL